MPLLKRSGPCPGGAADDIAATTPATTTFFASTVTDHAHRQLGLVPALLILGSVVGLIMIGHSSRNVPASKKKLWTSRHSRRHAQKQEGKEEAPAPEGSTAGYQHQAAWSRPSYLPPSRPRPRRPAPCSTYAMIL